MSNPFEKATDEEMVAVIKKTVESLNSQLEEAGRRDISVQVSMATKAAKPGVDEPVFKVTGAWKQLSPPIIFTL